MPKKKTTLSKLMKKHQEQKKKERDEYKGKRGKKPPRILNLRRVRAKGQEEENTRIFLEQVLEFKSDEDLVDYTRLYTDEIQDPWHRRLSKRFFFGPAGVTTLLPPDQYRIFIEAYLNQPTTRTIRTKIKKKGKSPKIVEKKVKVRVLPLEEFWKSYSERLAIRNIINDRIKDLEKEEEEKKRVEEILMKMQVEEEEIEEAGDEKRESPWVKIGGKWVSKEDAKKKKKKKKKKKSTIMVEAGPLDKLGIPSAGEVIDKVVQPKPKPVNFSAWTLKCMRETRKAPWLEETVVNIYIAPAKKSHIEKYFGDEKIKLVMDDKEIKLYKPSKAFYQLLCNRQSGRNYQKGRVLHAYTANGSLVRFYIVYEVRSDKKQASKMVWQDEKMFAKEKQYRRAQRITRKDRVNQLLSEPVTPLLKSIGSDRLSDVLRSIAPSNSLYGSQEADRFERWLDNNDDEAAPPPLPPPTPYVTTAIDSIAGESKSVKDFIERLSTLLTYLKAPDTEMFKNRIRQGWYLPETLVNLTPQQMFPEADVSGPTKIAQQNYNIIYVLTNRQTKTLSELYYQFSFPSARVPIRSVPNLLAGKRIQPNKWREKCKNKEEIKDVPDYKLLPYEEDGSIYCLNIDDIMIEELFVADPSELLNPWTNKPLRPDFVQMLKNTFTNWGYEEEEKKEEPILLDDSKEGSYVIVPEKEMIAPGLMDLVIKRITEDELELMEEEKSEAEEQQEDVSWVNIGGKWVKSVQSSDVLSPSEGDSTGESESDNESDNESDDVTRCRTCKKSLDDGYLRTIQIEHGEYKERRYCNGETCLGDANYKHKRSSGKKGGRKKTTDS